MGTAPYAEDASHVLDISNNSTSHFIGNKVSAKSVTRRFSASKPSPLGTSYTIRALYPLGGGGVEIKHMELKYLWQEENLEDDRAQKDCPKIKIVFHLE